MVIHNTGVQNTNTPASSGQTTANVREATARTQQTGRADTDEQRIREQLGTDRADETQESRKTADTREEAEARRLEALARREEERENVIARSEDGDTLQVEPEDADITDEDIGEVTARSQNPPQIPTLMNITSFGEADNCFNARAAASPMIKQPIIFIMGM